ncbi:hypothetical protein BTA51_14875 [Hahella sp. CCB-MM4]|uniref:hypothetical protein n=1 Tax=Hahella sp. (strain CCB-MM4) TaxID=1926491 RepID=UPI000B9BE0CA|nr:hypothetical protein [Hahella sp. CCB-MM4]OZG72412.1 hypothetical protein BTA51_14875 [Hahella sp. CCB-MM4]
MLNVIDFLGKAFTAEEDGSFIRTTIEGDEGHGLYSHHIEARNGLWQMNLDGNGVVQTIFLQVDPKSSLPFGLEAGMAPRDVLARFGIPDKKGDEQVNKLLGKYGPWMRFDREAMSIHVEFHADSHLLKQITIMLPEVAP